MKKEDNSTFHLHLAFEEEKEKKFKYKIMGVVHMATGNKDLLDRLDTMCKEVENITFELGRWNNWTKYKQDLSRKQLSIMIIYG